MDSQPLDINNHTGTHEANALYPMKVWLTALFLVAPLCLWIQNRIVYGNIKLSTQDIMTVPLLGLGAAVFSLPLYGILFLTFRFLTRKQVSSVQVRWILNTITVMGIFVTFKLIDENPQLITTICYSISTVIASLFFKIYLAPAQHIIRNKV